MANTEFDFDEFVEHKSVPDNLAAGDVINIVRSEEGSITTVSLFIRQHIVDKLEEVRIAFEDTKLQRLYVTGAPGCGKTCFFWMWAMMKMQMQKPKRLMLIQHRDVPSIWLFENSSIKKMTTPLLDRDNVVDVVQQLLNQQSSKFDFAIMDGVRMNDDLCQRLVSKLKSHTGEAKSSKISKSVFVTSLQFTIPRGYENRGVYFNVTVDISFDSWKDSDYSMAAESALVKNETVRQLLLQDWQILTSSIDSYEEHADDERVKQALKLKYHYAGGSARLMFENSLASALVDLRASIATVSDSDWDAMSSNRLTGAEPASVNSLMQRFSVEGRIFCLPISEFVLHHAYAKCRGKLTKSVKQAADHTQNASLLGWAFEMAELDKIHDALAANQDPVVNEQATRLALRADVLPSTVGGNNQLTFVPEFTVDYDGGEVTGEVKSGSVILCDKWNQGCFDVAFYMPRTLVTLQITKAKSHSLKLQHIKDLYKKLLQMGVEIDEVVHVGVLDKSCVDSFSFDAPTGTGRLTRKKKKLALCVKVVTSPELKLVKLPFAGASSTCEVDGGHPTHDIFYD